MKKFVLNISDSSYEKFRFEALSKGKSISDIIRERIFDKPFSEEVENAFDRFMQQQLTEIMNE